MPATSLPSKQLSLNITGKGSAAVVEDAPIPALDNDYVLVEVKAVALNPTDWKHIDYWPSTGSRVGCDYSGVVAAVGPNLTRDFKVGDRIAGVVHGSKIGGGKANERGAFGQYIAAKTGVAFHIPDDLSFEEAATLGVGISTVGQALYQNLKLPLPNESNGKKDTILIYGGSTATGTLAIQYAKLSGWKVLTTCSPRNFELVKSLGADEAFDYNDKDVAKKIRDATDNKLQYVLDCISLEHSTKICAEAIGSSGGHYATLLPVQNFPRSDVENRGTLAYSAFGESFKFGETEFPAQPQDYEFATKFWALSEELLKKKAIKAHPYTVGEKGLYGVVEGLDLLRKDKVSGKKLVYRIADTKK